MAVTVPAYGGSVPNRHTDTKEAFADNVYNWFTWISDSFTPNFNISAASVNDDISTIQGYMTTTLGYKDTTKTYMDTTEGYMNVAKGVANYKGDYDANTTYSLAESVTLNDNVYVSKVDNNTTAPTEFTSTTEWLFNGRRDFVYKTITADYTAVAYDGLDVDTSAGTITVTLPATPLEDDVIAFLDVKGTFDTNPLSIARNGNTIMGLAEDMVVDTKNISLKLRFTNNDWRLV